jgi:hypothetical protein
MAEPRLNRIHALLCGRRAYTLFRYSAWWITALAVFFAIAMLTYDRVASNEIARVAVQAIAAVIGSVGSAAGLAIFFGMLAYLFMCDQSSSKLLWLIIFLLTACFGSSVYFFTVYRRQIFRVAA